MEVFYRKSVCKDQNELDLQNSCKKAQGECFSAIKKYENKFLWHFPSLLLSPDKWAHYLAYIFDLVLKLQKNQERCQRIFQVSFAEKPVKNFLIMWPHQTLLKRTDERLPQAVFEEKFVWEFLPEDRIWNCHLKYLIVTPVLIFFKEKTYRETLTPKMKTTIWFIRLI